MQYGYGGVAWCTRTAHHHTTPPWVHHCTYADTLPGTHRGARLVIGLGYRALEHVMEAAAINGLIQA